MTHELTKVAKVDEVPAGSVKVVFAQGKRLALANSNGVFYAIDDLCTHDGGPLGEGELIGCEIECPRHGARFDVKTGQPVCLPAVVPVCAYPVVVQDGEIWVALKPADCEE